VTALILYDSHISAVARTLEKLELNANSILGEYPSDTSTIPVELTLKRSLSMSGTSGRIKSVCEINGHVVTLKALKAVGAPLLAIVNAPAAGAALGRASSRMSMIDTGASRSCNGVGYSFCIFSFFLVSDHHNYRHSFRSDNLGSSVATKVQ
jgi:hypothetical protein